MVQGNWAVGPLSVYFFSFLLCSSFPMTRSIANNGVGGFTLCASLPFVFFAPLLYFFFLSLFFSLVGTDPAMVGVGSLKIKYNDFIRYHIVIYEVSSHSSHCL